jgi:SAM-dependent methyltransferase
MARMRKPFQGVGNIIRFNWHYYVLAAAFILLLQYLANHLNEQFRIYISLLVFLIVGTIGISLLVSYYVYDLSGLYELNWLIKLGFQGKRSVVNINAGFDETSSLITDKFKQAELMVFDFYDPLKNTEISIKRARKAYVPYPGTKTVSSTSLPLKDKSIDDALILFAAHEIRNEKERVEFFKELNRVINSTGRIIIAEHLRDSANCIAYNVGCFHFYPKSSWRRVFKEARLNLHEEIKFTPFISIFILKPDGDSF